MTVVYCRFYNIMKNENNKKIMSKIKYLCLAVLVAVIGSLPFILFSDYIRRMSAIGYIGLFISTLLTNASVLLPASGIAFTVSAAMVLEPWICVLIGGLGTALGELVSYFCGRSGMKFAENSPLSLKLQHYLSKYGVITVFIFALLPLPLFDIVGIACGASKISMIKYMIACFLGKTIKLSIYVFLFKTTGYNIAG